MPSLAAPRLLDRITDALFARLSPRRARHSLGVGHTAVLLADVWGVPRDKALLAGLLHDVGKEEDAGTQRRRILASGPMDPEDKPFRGLWHARAGALIARDEFGIHDEEVLQAIRIHPTGEGAMSAFERIVFLADYTDPTRRFEGLAEVRRLARTDLVTAADRAILMKTEHVLQKKSRTLHAASRRALQSALARRAAAAESEVETCPRTAH